MGGKSRRLLIAAYVGASSEQPGLSPDSRGDVCSATVKVLAQRKTFLAAAREKQTDGRRSCLTTLVVRLRISERADSPAPNATVAPG